ncbi:hypothetical protein BDBG_05960 [Blastomyces gilchristii SLH14081]|uniref:Uncharacterized protein n=1 Tax=Blastomyces gilchristii (strain SLH14081) TaxID=559298 RepID=A0A179UTD8_BLAGS|nr:uncharacterized protein BDBG_05960 [Blastomyces gilchristii SLH14081]OAT10301.1 hypothetical protein BDBG_05960 [Blastomyces gilchristii SLH14081]
MASLSERYDTPPEQPVTIIEQGPRLSKGWGKGQRAVQCWTQKLKTRPDGAATQGGRGEAMQRQVTGRENESEPEIIGDVEGGRGKEYGVVRGYITTYDNLLRTLFWTGDDAARDETRKVEDPRGVFQARVTTTRRRRPLPDSIAEEQQGTERISVY